MHNEMHEYTARSVYWLLLVVGPRGFTFVDLSPLARPKALYSQSGFMV